MKLQQLNNKFSAFQINIDIMYVYNLNIKTKIILLHYIQGKVNTIKYNICNTR